jgi:hypothetical protein
MILILTLLTNSTILISVSPCLTVTVGFSLVPGYAYLLYLFKTLLMAASSKTLTFPFPANLHHYDVMTMTQVTQIERGRRGRMDL